MKREDLWITQMGGCRGWLFESHLTVARVVDRLMTCEAHDGRHHFAVFADGLGVAMSDTGLACVVRILREEDEA